MKHSRGSRSPGKVLYLFYANMHWIYRIKLKYSCSDLLTIKTHIMRSGAPLRVIFNKIKCSHNDRTDLRM